MPNKAKRSCLLLPHVSFTIPQDPRQCYYPDGSRATDWNLIPFSEASTAASATTHSQCCIPCHRCKCRSDGLWSIVYRGGCTDPTFSDPACPQICLDSKSQNGTWIWLAKCQGDGYEWRCGSETGILPDCFTTDPVNAIGDSAMDSAEHTSSLASVCGSIIVNNILKAAYSTNEGDTLIDKETLKAAIPTNPPKELFVTADEAPTTRPLIFAPPTAQVSSQNNTELPVGAIVGIALGGIVGLVLTGILLGLLRQRSLKNDPHPDDAFETPRPRYGQSVGYGQSEATSVYGNVYEISSGKTSPRRHMMSYRGAVELDEQGLGGTPGSESGAGRG